MNDTKQNSCPICDAQEFTVFRRIDHRTLARCLGCGHVFASAYDLGELVKCYCDNYYRSPDDPRIQAWIDRNAAVWNGLADDLRRTGRPIGSLLDIGAGTGGFLLAAHEAFPDMRLSAIESSPAATESLRRRLPSLNFPVNDASLLTNDASTYDCIALLQVLEHVENPAGLCREIHAHLNPEGVFLLTVPNRHSYERFTLGIQNSHCYGNPTHLQFFSDIGIKKILNGTGFKSVERVVPCDFMDELNSKKIARWILRRLAISTELRYIAYRR